LAPTWANTEEVDVELSSKEASIWSPVLRAGVVHAEPVTRIDPAGSTKFTWTSARLSGCPVRLRPMDRTELRFCTGLDIGIIGATGTPSSAGSRGTDSLSPWVGAFASLRVQVRVIGPIEGFAEAELGAPLTRYQFAFDPSTPVYDVAFVAGAGLAGVLVEIP
jgi:hypothetical protein